nr:Chain G, Oxysterol binding protein [synthetic construct]1Z9O_H Chain H, Oxysterol binding protein [synthetic construct]1Z9O_I Chain I, Oxysterol binding protein [synthetic construct]1Z9O_J Chain J, Oxysterol binding protein [synthetic construct]1Z9O_K Chain K, Oxysterol binding protein [synthetic construct]1Z9O_L Chain L, Oxysterol binding protein [synthetic construct]
SEDEFYDALS